MTIAVDAPMTSRDFLAFVDAHPHEKWELIDGRPVAMGGAWLRHALLGGNIAEALGPLARAQGCRVLRDMFLRAAANDGQIFDPDVMIRCGPIADQRTRILDDAAAVFEVLSPSTMAYDRGVKLEAYLATPSRRQAVIVYPGGVRGAAWRRDEGGAWAEGPLVLKSLEAALPVPAIEAVLPLHTIYEGVTLDG